MEGNSDTIDHQCTCFVIVREVQTDVTHSFLQGRLKCSHVGTDLVPYNIPRVKVPGVEQEKCDSHPWCVSGSVHNVFICICMCIVLSCLLPRNTTAVWSNACELSASIGWKKYECLVYLGTQAYFKVYHLGPKY